MPTPNVGPHEILYRQVGPKGNPIYYDPLRNPPIHPSVFLPSKEDTDGLSLIRKLFRSQKWAAYRKECPEVRFRIASLEEVRVIELAFAIGFIAFNFKPTEDALDTEYGEPWAHCVLIEINRPEYDSNPESKKKIKEWALAVANYLTDENIFGPFERPTEQDAYRPNPQS